MATTDLFHGDVDDEFVLDAGTTTVLTKQLLTRRLVVHFATPPTVLELDGWLMSCDVLDERGEGAFELRNQGALIFRNVRGRWL